MIGNEMRQIAEALQRESGRGSYGNPNIAKQLSNALQNDRMRSSPQVQQQVISMAFIAVLNDAMTKAADGGNFNLDTAINDLSSKFHGVRALQQRGDISSLKAAIPGQTQVFETMAGFMKEQKGTSAMSEKQGNSMSKEQQMRQARKG